MDVTEKIDLVTRDPTEEVVTREELVNLFNTNPHPKHYIGLEISGFLHLGSLILTGFKINDFVKAGVKCIVFLADWHTYINNKLGGDWEKIQIVSKYYADAFKLFCPGAEILEGSQLYESRKGYWMDLVKFAKNMSFDRTMRSLTIMGRSAEKDKIDLGQLFDRALDLRPFEPVPRRNRPIGGTESQHREDRDWGVVEAVDGHGRDRGQNEQQRDEGHPDHGDHSHPCGRSGGRRGRGAQRAGRPVRGRWSCR